MIVFRDFTFTYKSNKSATLHDINLSVRDGEKILIAGASGSGKSTLGSCLNGLAFHALGGKGEGSLEVGGLDATASDINDISKKVGTVLQDTDAQFVGLTVAEDIAFSLENQRTPQQEMVSSVAKTAKIVGMDAFLDSAPGDLSGGQKQRVALAGVLVDDVDILLFDEPLAALDPATGALAIDLIDDLNRTTGKTVVIIEHRIEEVLRRPVDRIVLIEEGRVVMDAPPAEVLRSGALPGLGLREPLHVTTLKMAGCDLSEVKGVGSAETLDITNCRDQLLGWFRNKRRALPEAEGGTVISFRDVTFSYDGKRNALDSVSFDIKKGEMVSILGKNGAGKSTLAGILTGILRPDKGQVLINGRDAAPDSIAERGRKIGYVMQNPNHMVSNMLVYDEVAFGLRNRGLSEEEIRPRVMDTLRLCSLERHHKWPISALSYGQKKRVTIASILVMDPEVLVLDEPTAGQDQRRYTAMMSFLTEVNRKTGVTILFVTHDLHLALEYTPRSVVLADGRLLSDAPISRVFADPALLERANLKVTGLYTLAGKLGLGPADTEAFIETFVMEEKKARGEEYETGGEAVAAEAPEAAPGKEAAAPAPKPVKFGVSYHHADSWVHRLNGAAKFFCLCAWIAVTLVTFDARILLPLLVTGLVSLATCKVPARKYRPFLFVMLGAVLLNSFFIYLFSPGQGTEYIGSRTILFGLPDTRYAPTLETLWYLLVVTMKYFSITPAALMFIYCTQPSAFAASLNKAGVGAGGSYAVALALRYIPEITDDYAKIRDSQACRGVELSGKAPLAKRVSGTCRILAPLVLSSIDRIDVITNAMVLRGFGRSKKRTWYREAKMRRADWIACLVPTLLFAAACVSRFGFGVMFWHPF